MLDGMELGFDVDENNEGGMDGVSVDVGYTG
jgi:hypothetical protein